MINVYPHVTRITTVWILTIMFTAIMMCIWYVFQPALVYVAIVVDNVMHGMGVNSTSTDNVVTLVKLGVNVSIPIGIIGLWLWAFVSSQKREWAGYEHE